MSISIKATPPHGEEWCINHVGVETATFGSPEYFCDLCWTMWFTEEYSYMSQGDLIGLRHLSIYELWEKHGFPGKEIEDRMFDDIVDLTKLEYKGFSGVYRGLIRFVHRVKLFFTGSNQGE